MLRINKLHSYHAIAMGTLVLAFHHHVQDGALGERRRGPDERVNGKKQDSGDKSFEKWRTAL
ncbi:MAG TPA: hypothetical protein VN901_09525 [Candidatus Acidoferrales bacterium]|nr:hypothetical protein [Candidatus Acidoferrales bacterium]